jgi:predicted membrane channel-forming protein YqfA (hemolysin III family)
VRQNWFEIITIWCLVLIGAIAVSLNFDETHIFAAFATVLAGSLALVSLIQLFRAEPAGFVRRLVYVGGGSYLILVLATVVIWLRG